MAPYQPRLKHAKKACWNDDDIFEMIVYIEHCRRSDPSGGKFKRTVTEHLQQVAGKKFYFEDVDEVVADLWKEYGVGESSECSDHSLLYVYGVYNISFIKNDRMMQKRLGRRLQQLNSQTIPRSSTGVRRSQSTGGLTAVEGPSQSGDTRSPFSEFTQEIDDGHEYVIDQTVHLDRSSLDDRQEEKNPQACLQPPESQIILPGETLLAAWYAEQLKEAYRREDKLKDKCFAMEEANSRREAQDESAIKQTLIDNMVQIRQLQSRLKDRSGLFRFTRGAYRKPQPADRQFFVHEIASIQCEIESIAIVSRRSRLQETIMSGNNPELTALCEDALCGDWQVFDLVSAQHLLESIVSMAVCRWVFEVEFRPNCMEAGFLTYILFDLLRATDGDDVVTDLQFAAHDAVVTSKYFRQCLIPQLAKSATRRLWKILKSIYHEETSAEHATEDEHPVQNKKEIKTRIRAMFTSAYLIRASAVTSVMNFQVILPSSHTNYDTNYMLSENHDKNPQLQDIIPTTSKNVLISTLPGLIWYPSERAQIDYGPFQRQGKSLPPDFDVLEKSRVWLFAAAQ